MFAVARPSVSRPLASHHLRIGENLQRWFCYPRPVPAMELAITRTVRCGCRFGSIDFLWLRSGPCALVKNWEIPLGSVYLRPAPSSTTVTGDSCPRRHCLQPYLDKSTSVSNVFSCVLTTLPPSRPLVHGRVSPYTLPIEICWVWRCSRSCALRHMLTPQGHSAFVVRTFTLQLGELRRLGQSVGHYDNRSSASHIRDTYRLWRLCRSRTGGPSIDRGGNVRSKLESKAYDVCWYNPRLGPCGSFVATSASACAETSQHTSAEASLPPLQLVHRPRKPCDIMRVLACGAPFFFTPLWSDPAWSPILRAAGVQHFCL